MLIALAATIAAMPRHSAGPRRWPSRTAPTVAASTGLTLMKSPNVRAAMRRRVNRSAPKGIAEDMTPAAIASRAGVGVGVGVCRAMTVAPIGRKTTAEIAAAVAEPWAPGTRRPTVRLSRMYAAQQAAASRPAQMPK